MQYLGGKSRIAKHIVPVMLSLTANRKTYIEPFLGAGSVAAIMVPEFKNAFLSDASPDLMALWFALQDGWQPPDVVTEDDYNALRNAEPSALRGFVGYGCSFGGKWFGGYARDPKRGTNFAAKANRLLLPRVPAVRNATFECMDYRDAVIPPGAVVYCDPPYAGMTKYGRLADFDSNEFWAIMEEWSIESAVFVSEYKAPDSWRPIWEGKPRVTLKLYNEDNPRANEYLWTYGKVN